MKENVTAKREFATLQEDKRPTYLSKIGSFMTTNATRFPLSPSAGTVITGKAIALLPLLAGKDDSKLAQDAYDKELGLDITMMDAVYDYIDLVAQGDSAIIALAGMNWTSENTSKIGIPSVPAGLVYEFPKSKAVGQMILARETDKLAMGSVTATFTNEDIKVIKSGDTQLKITCPPSTEETVLFIDIETATNLLIENQVKKTEIMSVMALFNTNGLSPVASPAPIVVPR